MWSVSVQTRSPQLSLRLREVAESGCLSQLLDIPPMDFRHQAASPGFGGFTWVWRLRLGLEWRFSRWGNHRSHRLIHYRGSHSSFPSFLLWWRILRWWPSGKLALNFDTAHGSFKNFLLSFYFTYFCACICVFIWVCTILLPVQVPVSNTWRM